MTQNPPGTLTPSDPAPLLIGAIAAQVVGGLITQMSPLVIGGLTHGLALSARDAGFLVSIEFLALAITAIAIAPILPRLSCRRIALAAATLALLADVASIFSGSWESFVLLRVLAGAGEGALYTVSLCVVACRSRNPDRAYGYFQVVWALGSVPLYALGGELTAAFAHRGILALIAGVTLVLAPLLLFIPDTRAGRADRAAADLPLASPFLGSVTVAATLLYLTACAAIFVFYAPLGELAGLHTSTIGYVLTVGSLVSLAGAGAATAIHTRWGRAIPISGSCISLSLVVLVLCLARNPTAYVVALVASFVIFSFSVPYLFGLAAALDSRGRWAAAAGSAYLLGFAAGPALGGAVIGAGGYSALAAACVTITVIVWVLAMAVTRRLARSARASIAAGLSGAS